MIFDFINGVLEGKERGIYVELGSGPPNDGSTTCRLESEKNWSGLSIEINPKEVDFFNSVRKNKAICADAISFDYKSYFLENNFPRQIDFLQVDIDAGYHENAKAVADPNNSLFGLIQLPLNEYRFSVITFEHEYLIDYQFDRMRDCQRYILSSLGYSLVQRYPHEDWWVDSTIIPYTRFKKYYFMAAP